MSQLHSIFSLKDLGILDYFLGTEVKYHPNVFLSPSQGKYIRDLLIKTNMHEAKPLSSPMVVGLKLQNLVRSDALSDQTMYRSVVGGSYMLRSQGQIFALLSTKYANLWLLHLKVIG